MEKEKNQLILLGARIRKLRQIKGWTQQELGERAEISYKYLGDIERGKENPTVNVLVKIADAFEIELSELLLSEQGTGSRKQIKTEITEILDVLPDDVLKKILLVLRVFRPVK